VEDAGGIRGRSSTDIGAGCVYIAARQEDCPQNIKEVARRAHLQTRAVARAFKAVVRKLNLASAAGSLSVIRVGDFTDRFCRVLQLPPGIAAGVTAVGRAAGTHALSHFIVSEPRCLAGHAYCLCVAHCERLLGTVVPEISGKSPLTVAAAAVVFVSRLTEHPKTPADLVRPSGMAEPTIASAWRSLEDARPALEAKLPEV
jgi:transcription initiation factor TFIIIB Brf1 subunit/transcription initiation factor TFIIB